MFIPAVARAARQQINTLQNVVPRILEVGRAGRLGSAESVRLAQAYMGAIAPLSEFMSRQVGEGAFPAVMADFARQDASLGVRLLDTVNHHSSLFVRDANFVTAGRVPMRDELIAMANQRLDNWSHQLRASTGY